MKAAQGYKLVYNLSTVAFILGIFLKPLSVPVVLLIALIAGVILRLNDMGLIILGGE